MNSARLSTTVAAIRSQFPELDGIALTPSGGVIGTAFGESIQTVLQPWRRADDGAVVACEAYTRPLAPAHADTSPWRRPADDWEDADLIRLDRTCRAVHAINYFLRSSAPVPLVLNVDARFLHAVGSRHGEFFARLLALLDVAPGRIVIETRTSKLLDLSRFREVVASYRKHGFAVAVNAEGIIHARALANILEPDYLMLEAGLFGGESLRTLVATLVPARVQVAVKCISNEALAADARAAGVAWVQGYHFDEPAPLA